MLKDLHDIIRTQLILVKRRTRWRSTITVGIDNPSEVLEELVKRKNTDCCVELLKDDTSVFCL
jgi:hypothetical protein